MTSILRFLRIEEGELSKTVLFFLAFFSGVSALILGRTIGDTLFLSRSSPSLLPFLYMGTALVTGAVSMMYSSFLAKAGRRVLIPTASLVFLAGTVAVRFLFAVVPSVAYPLFVIWVEVFGTVLTLQFWIVANDSFTSREARRLFPLITAAGLLGNVLCGLCVRTIVHRIGTENLLYLCAGTMAFYLLLLIPSLGNEPGEPRGPSARAPGGLHISRTSSDLFRSRYLRMVGGVILLTYLVSTLVDYQFKMTLKDVYTEERMASFFGAFYALIGIVSFLIQFFLTSRILERLGVLPSLLLLPVSMFAGSLGFFLKPVFRVSAAAKSSDMSLRYTIQYASLQILYLPFPPRMKERVTAFLDGVIKPVSMGMGGLVLLVLTQTLSLASIALVSSCCTLVWIGLTIALRREYISSLLLTLHSRRLEPGSARVVSLDTHTLHVLFAALEGGDDPQVLYAMDMLHHYAPEDLGTRLRVLVSHPSPKVRARAFSILSLRTDPGALPLITMGLHDHDPDVKEAAISAMSALDTPQSLGSLQGLLTDPDPGVRRSAAVALITRYGIDGFLAAGPALKALIESHDAETRRAGARALGEIGVRHFHQPLIALLSDPSPEVRKETIVACGKVRNPALAPHVIEKIADRHVRASAVQALAAYGENVLGVLSETLSSRRDPRISLSVPRVLAMIGTPGALSVLMGRLHEPFHPLRHAIVRGISAIHMKHPRYEIPHEPVEKRLNDSLQEYYAALVFFSPVDTHGARLLADTLREKMASLIDEIFLLLGLLYPSRTMATVFANLRSRVPAERANAVEVLDTLLPRSIKGILLPLVEGHPGEYGLRIAEERFHLTGKRYEDVLSALAADRSAWVRACALHTIGQDDGREFYELVLKGTGDPDAIVRETALNVLSRWGGTPPGGRGTYADNR